MCSVKTFFMWTFAILVPDEDDLASKFARLSLENTVGFYSEPQTVKDLTLEGSRVKDLLCVMTIPQMVSSIANRMRTRPVTTCIYQSLIASTDYANPRKTSAAFTDPTIGAFEEKIKPQLKELLLQIEEEEIVAELPENYADFEAYSHHHLFEALSRPVYAHELTFALEKRMTFALE